MLNHCSVFLDCPESVAVDHWHRERKSNEGHSSGNVLSGQIHGYRHPSCNIADDNASRYRWHSDVERDSWKQEMQSTEKRDVFHWLITIGTMSRLFVVIIAVKIWIVGKRAIVSAKRPTATLILKMPIETREWTMPAQGVKFIASCLVRHLLCTLVLQKQLTLFDAKISQITSEKRPFRPSLIRRKVTYFRCAVLSIKANCWRSLAMIEVNKNKWTLSRLLRICLTWFVPFFYYAIFLLLLLDLLTCWQSGDTEV